MTAGDGFLSRWARRKAEAKTGVPAPEAMPAPSAAEGARDPLLPTAPAAPATAPTRPATTAATAAPESAALPTLEDVARLTKESDFSPYVARDVDASVRNAAMKKLFSDPHFNVMDGLDTYIDDYGKPSPIPPSMLRRMYQASALGLFADETAAAAKAAPPPQASPDGAGHAGVAQSEPPVLPPVAPEHRTDDDPDLQLQRDDADRRSGAGEGAGD